MRELDPGDFRARRFVLEPDDFAVGSEEPDPPPSDLIDEATWRGLTDLPDDVSIRTSDHYGTTIKTLLSYCNEWNCLVGALQEASPESGQSPIAHVACDAGDELSASLFNALTGYYRVAFSTLRNIVEQMTVGLALELAHDAELFQDWANGKREFGLGWAADMLPKYERVKAIEEFCRSKFHDDFFRQKNKPSPGGYVRRLFSRLSKFVHGNPGSTDADMRQSNGPIFLPATFEEWADTFRETYALGVLNAKIAKEDLQHLAWGSKLTSLQLFRAIVDELPSEANGRKLLCAARTVAWKHGGPC